MNCGVGCRHGLDPALLWLWHRQVAMDPIQPLAWEPSYAMGVAQEMAKKTKKNIWCFPFVDQQLTNQTRTHEDAGLIHGFAQWVKDLALP